jgi:putative flippase GtrA
MGGRKRRFLFYGLLNVALTNALLQVLLRLLPIGLATLLSQLLNVGLGYVLYGKKVFAVKRFHTASAAAYGLMALGLWLINWAGIHQLSQWGLSRGMAALLLIPVLALISYGVQKTLVFPPEPCC